MGSDASTHQDGAALEAVLEATRALLWISSPTDARSVTADLVDGLGGDVATARDNASHSLPIDLSFGDGEPVVPCAAPGSTARRLLERHLPSFVEDARRAVGLGSQADRLAEAASIDTLTGLQNRRMLGRALGRLEPTDVVVMIDLDHFKQINDTYGHLVGDRVLQAMGRALLNSARERDSIARYGGEEFAVILRGSDDPEAFLRRLRQTWERERPQPTTFSAGIARVGERGADTLQAADRALYRAKANGRDRWVWAPEDDTSDSRPEDEVGGPDGETIDTGFVAVSDIVVPGGGADALETAFRDRLGAVDGAPGFRTLEVWSDLQDPTAYTMVSWWESRDAFQHYMRSADHRQSHDRIPVGTDRPRAGRFRRFEIVAR